MNVIIWMQSKKHHKPDTLINGNQLLRADDIARSSLVKQIIDTFRIGKKISKSKLPFIISKHQNNYAIKFTSNERDEFNRLLPVYIYLEGFSPTSQVSTFEEQIKTSSKLMSASVDSDQIKEYLQEILAHQQRVIINKRVLIALISIILAFVLIIGFSNYTGTTTPITPTYTVTLTPTQTLTPTPSHIPTFTPSPTITAESSQASFPSDLDTPTP